MRRPIVGLLITGILAGQVQAGPVVRAVRAQAGVPLGPALQAGAGSAAALSLRGPAALPASLPVLPSLSSAFSPKTQSLHASHGGVHSVGATGVHQGGQAPLIHPQATQRNGFPSEGNPWRRSSKEERRSTQGHARTAKGVLREMGRLSSGLTRSSSERAAAQASRTWDRASESLQGGGPVLAGRSRASSLQGISSGRLAAAGEGRSSAGQAAPANPSLIIKEEPKARRILKRALIGAGALAGAAGLFAAAKWILAASGMETVSEFSLGAMGIAFLAGLLSFLSPCTLCLIPGYISMISGSTLRQGADPAAQRSAFWRAGIGSIVFVAGFSVVFVALGATATAVGAFLFDYLPLITMAAGGVVTLFGLHLLLSSFGKHIPFLSNLLYQEKRFHATNSKASFLGAFLMGLAFAFGWTPCIGPILGGILGMAAMEETVLQGVALLLAYSLGLGIPFIASGFAVNKFNAFFQRYKRFIGWGERLAALVLIAVGALMIKNNFSLFTYWLGQATGWW